MLPVTFGGDMLMTSTPFTALLVFLFVVSFLDLLFCHLRCACKQSGVRFIGVSAYRGAFEDCSNLAAHRY